MSCMYNFFKVCLHSSVCDGDVQGVCVWSDLADAVYIYKCSAREQNRDACARSLVRCISKMCKKKSPAGNSAWQDICFSFCLFVELCKSVMFSINNYNNQQHRYSHTHIHTDHVASHWHWHQSAYTETAPRIA